MRSFTILLFASIFILACNPEEFIERDPSSFNAQIAERTDIHSPEDLIMEYYGQPEHEGPLELNISSKRKAQSGRYIITLVHDKLLDDSQRATKIVMDALWNTDSTWKVNGIQKNWKCWEGRGHTDWGIEFCN